MVKRSAQLSRNAGGTMLACIKGRVREVNCVLITNLSRPQQVK
jgi:hypothetical protein